MHSAQWPDSQHRGKAGANHTDREAAAVDQHVEEVGDPGDRERSRRYVSRTFGKKPRGFCDYAHAHLHAQMLKSLFLK